MNESSSESDPLGSMAESFLRRFRRGERPPLTEYTDRYPDLAGQVRELFPALVLMEQFGSDPDTSAIPYAGPSGPSGPLPQRMGDYLLLREIGRGGMGVVYEAIQESLGRHVALKVLPTLGQVSPTRVRRFQREARTAAGLHHTNIVPVYGVGVHEGIHYYAMQLIRGQTLDAVLPAIRRLRARVAAAHEPAPRNGHDSGDGIARGSSAGRLAAGPHEVEGRTQGGGAVEMSSAPASTLTGGSGWNKAGWDERGKGLTELLSSPTEAEYYRGVARVGLQVAEALAYGHQQGILHRDIKPSNLLLDYGGAVWVTDFGLAKAEAEEGLTRTGDFVGTLRYMAPERFLGRSDPRSDVYGLGATLYELLTLRPVFEDKDRPRLIERIVHEDPTPPRSLAPHIPRDLETIVLKAMARDPADRYPTAAALVEDLRRFLTDRAIRARPATAVEKLWRWSGRNPAIAVLGATVATLLAMIAVGASLSAVRNRDRAEREARFRNRNEQSEAQLKAVNSDLVRGYYFQRIALAQGALAIGNLDHAKDLLEDGCPSALRGWEWHSLRRLLSGPPLCLLGKARVPEAVAFSRDGRLLASVNSPRDGTITIRDAATRRHVQALEGHSGSVRLAIFLPDGKRLISASQILGAYGRLVACEVREWDTTTGERVRTRLLTLPAPEWLLATDFKGDFSPDGRRFVFSNMADDRGTVRIFDVANGREQSTLRGHSKRVESVAFSPDGLRVASVSEDQTVRLWETATGRESRTLRRGNEPLTAVTFSRNGSLLASGSFYGTVTIWDVATGREIHTFLGHDAPVGGLSFHPDGTRLASASEDGTVRVWHAATGRELLSFKSLAGSAPNVAFSPDGTRLAASNWDWKVAADGTNHQYKTEIRVWDGSPAEERSNEPVMTLRGHTGGVVCLAFSPDGRRLASGGEDRTVIVWDLASGRRVLTLGGHDDTVSRVAFAPDGPLLASGTADGTVSLWDFTTGTRLKKFTAGRDHGWIVNMAFSPDGTRLASAHESSRGGVWIWEVATGRLLHAFRGHSLGGWGALFGADGTQLLTAGGEAVVKTWDLATGRELRSFVLRGTIGRAVAVAFSTDRARLLRSSYDRTVTIWDMTSGERLMALEGIASEAWSVAYRPDGRQIATAH